MESTEGPRTSNIDSIKTTNFLRKLHKIDSTENILNFVQLTEYKKTPKTKTRHSKKKRTKSIRTNVEEHRDETCTGAQIKVTDSRTSQNIQIRRSDPNNDQKILVKDSDSKTSQKMQTKEHDSRLGQKVQIKESDSRIDHKVQVQGSDSRIGQKIEMKETDSRTSETSLLRNPTQISRKDKGESINIVMNPDDRNSSYESLTDRIIKRNSSKYFETKSLIEEMSSEHLTHEQGLKDHVSNNNTTNASKTAIQKIEHTETNMTLPSCSITDLVKTMSSLGLFKRSQNSFSITEMNPQGNDGNTSHSKELLHECYNAIQEQCSQILRNRFAKDFVVMESTSRRSIKLSEDNSDIEIRNSLIMLGNSVEKFVKQINLEENTDNGSEETSVLFKRNARSNDSIESRIVNFENSKIPIPIKTKPTEIPQTNERVENVDDPASIEVEYPIEPTSENISNDVTISSMQTENDSNAGYACNVSTSKSRKEEETTQISNILTDSEETSLSISQRNIKIHQKQAKSGTIKSKLSIFNSGVLNERGHRSILLTNSKKKINRTKETISKIPLNPGKALQKNKSYVSLMVQRKIDNVQNKCNAQTSIRNVTHSFIKPECSDSYKTIKMKNKTPKKIAVKRIDKSETESKVSTILNN